MEYRSIQDVQDLSTSNYLGGGGVGGDVVYKRDYLNSVNERWGRCASLADLRFLKVIASFHRWRS